MLAGGRYCGAVRYGIEAAKLRVIQGAEAISRLGDETGHNAFCRACGSLLYSLMREGQHIFVGSKASWYQITDDLPQYEDFPP